MIFGFDENWVSTLWGTIKSAISKKQDRLTGLPGQTVGFDESGNAKASEIIQGRTIELRGAEGAGKNYIDFHYDGSPEDYTARIIEDTEGVLSLVGDVKVSGIFTASNIPHYFSNRNLLDNWYFLNPINQRGQEEYIGAGYGIDRWYIRNSAKMLLTGNGMQIVYSPEGVSAGTGVDGYISQKIEIDPNESFQRITISALVGAMEDGALGGVRIIVWGTSKVLMDNSTNTDTTGLVSKTVDLSNINPQEIASIEFRLSCSHAQKKVEYVAAKLELGDQQTLAHQDTSGKWILNDPPPNKVLELAKCQRYFFRLSPDSLSNLLIGTGYKISNEKAAITIVTPVEMRTRQAIRCNDISKLTVSSYISTFAKPTGLYLETKAGNQMRVSLSGDFKDFSYGVAILSMDPDCCLDFDANL